MYASLGWKTVARSQQIADRVDLQLSLSQRHFLVRAPAGRTGVTTCATVRSRPARRYVNILIAGKLLTRFGQFSDEVRKRLVVNWNHQQACFADYFLIVGDFVRYATERGIPCTARGSGVGSLVCYAMRISHVCPLH
jgi:DNA polymerase-3 subunit alpha